MKIRSSKLIFFLAILVLGCSDNNEFKGVDAISLCDQASEYYKLKDSKPKALRIWKHLINNEPDSTYAFGMSINNLHQHYVGIKHISNSEKYFEILIESNINDRTYMTNIMEPYSNFRHNACIAMFQLYASKKKYDKALKYLQLAKNRHQYQSTSGTSLEIKASHLNIYMSRLLYDLGRKNKSISTLIESSLNRTISHPKFNNYTKSNKRTEAVLTELSLTYTKDEIKDIANQLEAGIQNFRIDNNDKNIIIPYLDEAIRINNKFTTERTLNIIKESFLLNEMRLGKD